MLIAQLKHLNFSPLAVLSSLLWWRWSSPLWPSHLVLDNSWQERSEFTHFSSVMGHFGFPFVAEFMSVFNQCSRHWLEYIISRAAIDLFSALSSSGGLATVHVINMILLCLHHWCRIPVFFFLLFLLFLDIFQTVLQGTTKTHTVFCTLWERAAGLWSCTVHVGTKS